MSDIDKLIAAFDRGELLRPSPESPNVVDLSRAVALLGRAEGLAPTRGSKAIADLIGPSEHLVFVLADGLGMNLVEMMPENTFLRSHLATELRTVFPSTTAVALTSIATCAWPNEHAITGWWTHLPEIESAATILQYVKRSDRRSLNDYGVSLEQAFPLPSVMGTIGRDALTFLPEGISGSIYSSYFSGGRPLYGYRNLREAVDKVITRVQSAAKPTYTYLYTPRIDEAAHMYGVSRPEVMGAILDLDREIERLALGVGLECRVIVSADHGFLDASKGERHQVRPSDPLMDCLRFPPSGDARVMYLHVRDSAVDQAIRYFHSRFGERFMVIKLDEAEKVGLLGPGPISPVTKSRLGDLIVISMGSDVIEYRAPGSSNRITTEASHHSGLTPNEMRIPLVIA